MINALQKESEQRGLNIEDKLNISWFRSLDEMDREIVKLFIAAFQKSQQSLESLDIKAVLDGFQEGYLIAA